MYNTCTNFQGHHIHHEFGNLNIGLKGTIGAWLLQATIMCITLGTLLVCTYNVVEFLPPLERKWKPYQGWTPTSSNSFFWKTMNQNCGFQGLAATECLIDNFVSVFIWKTMHQNWPLALLDRQLCFSFIWRTRHQNCGFQMVANHTMLNRQVHSSFCQEKRKSGFQIFSLTLSRIIVTLSHIFPLVL